MKFSQLKNNLLEFPNLIISKSEAPKAHQYCSILIFIISLRCSLILLIYIFPFLSLSIVPFYVVHILPISAHNFHFHSHLCIKKSNILSRFSVSSAFCACALYIMESLYVYIYTTTSIDHVLRSYFLIVETFSELLRQILVRKCCVMGF